MAARVAATNHILDAIPILLRCYSADTIVRVSPPIEPHLRCRCNRAGASQASDSPKNPKSWSGLVRSILPNRGDQAIEPRDSFVFWAGGQIGKPFAMTVPRGKCQAIDRLTAIGTTVLTKDLRYLRVDRKFEDILAITRGEMRSTTKDIGDDDERGTIRRPSNGRRRRRS